MFRAISLLDDLGFIVRVCYQLRYLRFHSPLSRLHSHSSASPLSGAPLSPKPSLPPTPLHPLRVTSAFLHFLSISFSFVPLSPPSSPCPHYPSSSIKTDLVWPKSAIFGLLGFPHKVLCIPFASIVININLGFPHKIQDCPCLELGLLVISVSFPLRSHSASTSAPYPRPPSLHLRFPSTSSHRSTSAPLHSTSGSLGYCVCPDIYVLLPISF